MKKMLYDYYKLVQKDVSEVSKIWIDLHVICFSICVVCSIVSLVFLNILQDYFDMNCIMYPRHIVMFKDLIEASETALGKYTIDPDFPIDLINSQWSDPNVCFFPYFNPILSTIFGIVWITFFVMCSSLTRPWRIVIPALIFTFIYSIFSISIFFSLRNGFMEFNEMFRNVTVTDGFSDNPLVKRVFYYVDICIATDCLNCIFWICSTLLLMMRCLLVVDFNLIHVKVELVKLKGNILAPRASSEEMSLEDSGSKLEIESPLVVRIQHTDATKSILKKGITKSPSLQDTFLELEKSPGVSGNRPKKVVYLMKPKDVMDSSVDIPNEQQNRPDLTKMDFTNVPFTQFVIEPTDKIDNNSNENLNI